MKKVVLLLVLGLMAGGAFAQPKFSVPEIPDSTRYQRMVGQTNIMLLAGINHAKELGKTVEETSIYLGDLFKTTWNQENGFEGFANGSLYNFCCFNPYGEIEILEQSENHLVFEATNFCGWLKKQGPVFNVTYDEYLTCLRIVHEIIAEYMNSTASIEQNEKGIVVTIREKSS